MISVYTDRIKEILLAGKTSSLLFLSMLFIIRAGAQSYTQVHLNRNNGLPSNHVYELVADKHGYLWVATDKGIARYNGYECKTFNTSDGLPTNDIWGLYKDRKMRLWVLGISNKLCYISNGKYHVVATEDNFIYPGKIIENDSGLLIFNKHAVTTSADHSKYPRTTGKLLFKDKYAPASSKRDATTRKGFDFPRTENGIVQFIALIDGQLTEIKRCAFRPPFASLLTVTNILQYQNYVFYFNHKGDKISLLLPENCELIPFFQNTPGKHFTFMHTSSHSDCSEGKFLYILYHEQIDKLDSNLNVLQSWRVSSLTNQTNGADIVYLYEDSLWGKCVASQTNGAFLNRESISHFKKLAINANTTVFLGAADDSISYWWHRDKNEIIVKNGNKASAFHAGHVTPRKIISDKKGRQLLLGNQIHIFNNATGMSSTLTPYYLKSAVVAGQNLYGITSADILRFNISTGTTTDTPIFKSIFKDVLYDSAMGNVYAYNGNSVLIYKDTANHFFFLNEDALRSFGVDMIDKILLDERYRNIFIKSHDQLSVYNIGSQGFRHILKNRNLADAKAIIAQKDVLVVAGRFGIAFVKILGVGRFSKPVIYYNDRDQYFSDIGDIHSAGKEVLLTTDRGFFSVSIPPVITSRGEKLPYNLLVKQGDDISQVNTGDTITTQQQLASLQFDLIRPSGNGRPRYKYRAPGSNTGWVNMEGSELKLSTLAPGKHHTFQIKIQDEVWISDPLTFTIYRLPTWWQTVMGKAVLTAIVILCTGIIVAFTVFATRRIIVRRIEQKNELLELKLKAVYAQINPHFIFNTLNSALLLINNNKMPEAYSHISRFSRLLRAYVKSSRNKFISIQDEVENLKNYMDLQQTRFKDIFSYNISIDNAISPAELMIPSLLLQPFVENAINHGLLNKKGKGHLQVNFKKNKFGSLTCTIDDDGIGRLAAMEQEKTDTLKESYGNELIKDLVNTFRKYEDMQIEIKYYDKEHPQSGTVVEIEIKSPSYEK